jgi:hypothetical protein
MGRVIPFALLTATSVLDIHPWSLDPTMALRAYGACCCHMKVGMRRSFAT